MKVAITEVDTKNVGEFITLFQTILKHEFPGYSAESLAYFFTQGYTKSNFSYWISNKMKTVLMAYDETSIPLGFAVIDESYGGVSLCRWLGVLKTHQKKGIGRLLITTWEEIAKKQNCHKLELAAQPQAKEFYEKVGLICEGFRKKSYFGIDQYIFGKILVI